MLPTGLRDFKDILNSRQNRSKKKLVLENADTCTWKLLASGYRFLRTESIFVLTCVIAWYPLPAFADPSSVYTLTFDLVKGSPVFFTVIRASTCAFLTTGPATNTLSFVNWITGSAGKRKSQFKSPKTCNGPIKNVGAQCVQDGG